MSDVIELNQHRLLCGDATNKNDVDKLIGDCKVNLLLTDPPYGIDIVKIGGGKLEDKVDTPLDHSNKERERERAMGTICGYKLKPSAPFKRTNRGGETTNIQGSKGYVGKPRHCSTKTLQTSNRR